MKNGSLGATWFIELLVFCAQSTDTVTSRWGGYMKMQRRVQILVVRPIYFALNAEENVTCQLKEQKETKQKKEQTNNTPLLPPKTTCWYLFVFFPYKMDIWHNFSPLLHRQILFMTNWKQLLMHICHSNLCNATLTQKYIEKQPYCFLQEKVLFICKAYMKALIIHDNNGLKGIQTIMITGKTWPVFVDIHRICYSLCLSSSTGQIWVTYLYGS